MSLCDFNIIEMGNPNRSHQYTVPCVLPINLFNQQIFTMIWCWYMFLLAWNIINLISWTLKSLPTRARRWNLRRIMLINKKIVERKKRINHFLRTYLSMDGLFIIRMIANNTSDYVATDVIHQLWCQHADKYDRLFPDEPHRIAGDKPCVFKHINRQINQNTDIFIQEASDCFNPNSYCSRQSVDDGNLQRQQSIDDGIDLQARFTTENEITTRRKSVRNVSIAPPNSDDESPDNFSAMRRLRKFKKNDLVMVRTNDTISNLEPTWEGPFKIIEREEPNYYKIEPACGGLKIKVHVKRLRPFKPMFDKKNLEKSMPNCGLS